MNMKKGMLQQKRINQFPSMPRCIINPEVYDFPSEPMDYLGKHLRKTKGVSLYPFHNAMPSIDRIYPSKNIQSMMMLAACIYIRLGSFFGPYSTKFRMKRKSRFIFKKYDLFTLAFLDVTEFFLTLHETASPPYQWLVDILINWPP